MKLLSVIMPVVVNYYLVPNFHIKLALRRKPMNMFYKFGRHASVFKIIVVLRMKNHSIKNRSFHENVCITTHVQKLVWHLFGNDLAHKVW